MSENYQIVKVSSPYQDLSPESRRKARMKGGVTWNKLAPPFVVPATHKFSFIDAVETASLLLDTNYTKDTETLIVGRNALLIVRTLPHFCLSPAPEGAMMKVYDGPLLANVTKGDLGVVGKLGDRLVLWASEDNMANVAKLVNSTSEVTIQLVEEEYARDPQTGGWSFLAKDKKAPQDEFPFVHPDEKEQNRQAMHGGPGAPGKTNGEIVMGFVILLDEALRCDRAALQNLLEYRVLCNEQMAAHPTIQVSDASDEVGTLGNAVKVGGRFSVLGLINGICEKLTGEKVCAVVDTDTGVIQMFGIYAPPMEQDERKAAV